MRLRKLELTVVMAIVCVVGMTSAQEKSRQIRLPGARAVIEACYYESIQAALDALPETGGIVQLPPGVFEISEPLVVRHSDVTIQGVGTATHSGIAISVLAR